MMKYKIPFTKTVLAGAIFTLATAASAQDFMLEEVIVTAQKKAENIQDIPSTVTAISGDAINEYAMLSIDDIGNLTSGVSFDRPDARRQTMTIRGITSDPDNVAASPITSYWNEQAIRTGEAFAGLYDMERIEILRGPQGTLQGKTDPAGSVHFYTAKPNTSQIDGHVQQIFSDNSGSNTQAGISFPIIEDVLAIRIGGLFDTNDGQEIKNVNNGQEENSETKSGRLTISWMPTDSFETTFYYQNTQIDSEIPQAMAGAFNNSQLAVIGGTKYLGGLIYGSSVANIQADPFARSAPWYNFTGVPAFDDNTNTTAYATSLFMKDNYSPSHLAGVSLNQEDRTAINGGLHTRSNENEMFNLNMNWDLGSHTIVGILAYKDNVNDNILDRDDVGVLPLPQYQQTTSQTESKQAELRINNNEGDFWEYTVGLYYQKSPSTTDNVVDVSGQIATLGTFPGIEQGDIFLHTYVPIESENFSVFTHNTFHFSDTTNLQVGLRWQENKFFSKTDITTHTPYMPPGGSDFTPTNNYYSPGDTPYGVQYPCFPDENGSQGSCEFYNAIGDQILGGLNAGTLPGAYYGQVLPGFPGWRDTETGDLPPPGSTVGYTQALIPEEYQNSKESTWTGGLKMTHFFATDLMAYASLDRSFRPAGITITPSPLPASELLWDSETSDSLELGIKSTVWDGRLRINASIFMQKYDGYLARADESVYYEYDANGENPEKNNVQGGITFNADTTVQGIEAEFQSLLTETWSLGGSIAYIDATFDGGATGPCNRDLTAEEEANQVVVPYCDISGARVSDQPRESANLFSEFYVPTGNVEWYVRGQYAYKGERINYQVTERTIDAYGVFNLFAGVRSGNGAWDVNIWAKNLADKQAAAGIFTNTLTGFDTGMRKSTMIQPRLIGMTLRYNFGI
ncbi:MAG: TonB-dependent receptor [Pseudomonadales bacterium]